MDNKLLNKLAKSAWKASQIRWGCYPMAPSIGLTEKEIALHQKAIDAHGKAYEALMEAGYTVDAERHKKAMDKHSWVTTRVGNFS